MKNVIKITLATIFLIGCAKKNEHNNQKESDAINKLSEVSVDTAVAQVQIENVKKALKNYEIFKPILDYPKIIDTTGFIKKLKDNYEMNNSGCYKINIKNYKKVKLYGSEKKYIIIETDCDFNNVKYQLAIFTENGNFIKSISGYRYELVNLFPNENPVLLNLDVSNQGNGGHQFFKMRNDTLKSINEIYEDFPNTFDRHQDNAIFEPNELNMAFKDENNDGFNDIVFKGQIILIQGKTKNGEWIDGEKINGKDVMYSIENPFKKKYIKFVLLYDKKTETFKPKEDYKLKYRDYYH